MKWPTRTDRPTVVGIALAALVAAWGLVPAQSPEKSYAPYPDPDAGYITDLAGLLPASDEQRLENLLYDLEKKTGVEMAVVTIGSIDDYPGTGANTIEAFATGLFDSYGIGNLPRNDGVLLVVARGDRRARIELGEHYGRGRDGDARRIMDDVIIPAFKNDDYAGGIRDGVEALMLEFAGVRVGLNWPLILTLVAIPIVALIAFSLFRSGKKGWGWVCVGVLIVLLLALWWMLRKAPELSSAGGYGGGFGGGSSGGGGASGSW